MSLKDLFLQHTAQTSDHPVGIEVAKAEGVYLYDTNGKRYIDLIAGIAVSNVGHRHPEVVAAIKNQVDHYMHVMAYGEYVQQPTILLAKALADALPQHLNTSYFVNSGTEANEGALKLAKRHTGRTQLIACKNSYHGSTHGSLSVTGNETKKHAFRPLLPDIRFIEFNREEDIQHITEKTAAVIIEPVQGDAGVRIPSLSYMQQLRAQCTATGTLLIFDEVQTGFGRTGSLFAFEQFGITPDVLTLAKGMGAGLPIGAFIASHEIMTSLKHAPMLGHITTFGGNPVCCAAALANLKILQGGLLKDVHTKGALFKTLLQHPEIREVRGIGLMLAVEFDSFETVHKIFHECLKNGVVAFWFLSCNNSFRIAPPLTISEDEIREACDIILQSIDNVC